MTPRQDDPRAACARLTYLAEPANPILGALLQVLPPDEVVAAIRSGNIPAARLAETQAARIRPMLAGWRAQLASVPPDAGVAQHAANGIHLLCPGDPEWPSRLDDLGVGRPYALWVRGTTDPQSLCGKSVAVVGSRAATAYGIHVSAEITTTLSADGWAIVSGGAYGIDAAAHRAALAAGGPTVVVLACGPDIAYPRGHARLFDAVAANGAIISESPPGTPPDRARFLARNRLIAALACGTLVVEASPRSGTLVTARHAIELGRPMMAVPGPVTSAMSAGCNALLRDRRAECVTCAADVLTHIHEALP
ncbi:MAG TPA: DNA-processing protein DprA [Streptosporangiaceae bacterium]|nr:DNA-processing protein DprA [Streptosporangiaceae bacterium]